MSIFSFRASDGAILVSGAGDATDFDLFVDNQLSTARLVGDLGFVDFNSGTQDIMHVDLSWTATGDRVKDSETVIINEPGFHFNGHFNHRLRDAVATGSITVLGKEWAPGPANIGQIQDNKDAHTSVTFGE